MARVERSSEDDRYQNSLEDKPEDQSSNPQNLVSEETYLRRAIDAFRSNNSNYFYQIVESHTFKPSNHGVSLKISIYIY